MKILQLNTMRWLFCCILMASAGCGRFGSVTPLSESEIDAAIAAASPTNSYQDDMTQKRSTGYEATKWITTNGNFAPFGSNHFETRDAAVKYMRQLYGLGATAVYIVDVLDEPERIKSEGGPYSDTMWVYLPPSGPRRRALFKLEAKEANAQGFVGSKDTGQEYLLFWMHE